MALTGLAALVLWGCGARGDWVGDWRGQRETVNVPGADPSVAFSLALVKLKIKKDGLFELTENSFGKGGSIMMGSDTATLNIDTMLGRSIQSLGPEALAQGGERRLKLRPDGTILLMRDGFEPVVLKRTKE